MDTHACLCFRAPDLDLDFCSSDFVFKVQVGESTTETVGGSPVKRIAITQLQATYRFTDFDVNNYPDLTALYTEPTSCQVYLTENTWYIVAGSISDGLLWLHGCDYIKEWTYATGQEKSMLANGDYAQNCD